MESKAAYKYSVLSPVWGVLCETLKERRVYLVECLILHEDTMIRGRIQEIDVTMDILEKLELEAKIK